MQRLWSAERAHGREPWQGRGGETRSAEVPAREDAFPTVRALAALRDAWRCRRPVARTAGRALGWGATHEAFALDVQGKCCPGGRVLGKLKRGASLTLPEVRLLNRRSSARAALAAATPSARLRAGHGGSAARAAQGARALVARSVRAVAYQLEQGLGSALTLDLGPTAPGSRSSQNELVRRGVELGRLRVALSVAMRRDALEQRAALLSATGWCGFAATLGVLAIRSPGSQRSCLARAGYVPLGSWALRCDLAERAAIAVGEGAT